MATRITVTLTGALGLDDADLLLTELEEETGLDWRAEDRSDVRHLGGVDHILLDALLSGTVELSLHAALDKAREIVRDWQERRLDPPDASVEAEQVEESGPAREPGAAESPDASIPALED